MMAHAACHLYHACKNAVALLCESLWGCRVAEGQDMKTICRRVHDKAVTLQGPELNALMAWMWQFSLHVTYLLSQVQILFCCCKALSASWLFDVMAVITLCMFVSSAWTSQLLCLLLLFCETLASLLPECKADLLAATAHVVLSCHAYRNVVCGMLFVHVTALYSMPSGHFDAAKLNGQSKSLSCIEM